MAAVKKHNNNKYSKFDTKFIICRPRRNDMVRTLKCRDLKEIFMLFVIENIRSLQKLDPFTVFPHIVSAETILFWLWPYVLWPLITVHKCAETIQGRKLFKDGSYSRVETIRGNMMICFLSSLYPSTLWKKNRWAPNQATFLKIGQIARKFRW